MPTRASDLQVDPVGRVMLIGCGAALFGLRLAVRFTAGRGPSIRSMRTSVPESVPAGFVICGNMSMPEELIPADRCWELLATVSVGRLALSVRALPMILPVQYYLDGRRLAVCLGHHQLPDRALNDVIIAFAADAIDPVTRSGWSVEVQGRSVIPRRLGADTACGRPTAGQIVQIEPGIISGHHMRLCPFIEARRWSGHPAPRGRGCC